jgi:AcrR family transcriptional regulator
MLDDFTPRAKAIRALLKLAEERSFGDIALSDIAQEAGVSLADLRREFSCRSDILRAFQADIDVEVLGKAKQGAEQKPRDRLFEIVMTRFEVMTPYKPALKRIASYLACHPGEGGLLACSSLASQYWMLAGAGARLDGMRGAVRVAGLAAIYGKVFRIWLDDPSPSLDKTLAALDRRLAEGEQRLKRTEEACARLCRIACGLVPRGFGRRPRAPEPPPSPRPAAS